MSSPERLYDLACQHARHTAVLVSVESLLGWDERCLMPPAAGDYRAEQMTLLAGMIHDRQTDDQYGQWLTELADGPLPADENGEAAATIKQLKRQYEKKVKLPKSLVEELTRTSVRGQQAWQEAREKKDFGLFRPLLEKTVELKRQQADALGYDDHPYDALLDEFEQGESTSRLAGVLAALREELVPLIKAIRATGRHPDLSLLARPYPIDKQSAFGRQVAAQIGFDFQRGRLDVTAHPFCTTTGPHDCRITTRYFERAFNSGFFGILHEAGHGIYEQGLRPDEYGLPLGEAVSLGIHESQSRMWENLVGRSRAFWTYFFPRAQQVYPAALGDVSLDDFYFAANDVRPSLVRVEADEATYNLHILVRFELEQDLLADRLRVADLPAAWNAKYRAALDISPTDDADGVLQDIHWSAGLVGYFPTYSLGNLYAAQFYEAADRELGGVETQVAAGDFEPLKNWLRTNIHQYGQRYTAAELIERASGRALSHAPLIRHLKNKLAPLYGL